MSPFEFFAPSPLLRVRSWLHPFKGHCEQQAMRDEGVIHVASHPLLNRRCTRLPGCIRLRNDLYCVEWSVKLYSLTQLPKRTNHYPVEISGSWYHFGRNRILKNGRISSQPEPDIRYIRNDYVVLIAIKHMIWFARQRNVIPTTSWCLTNHCHYY